MKYRKMQNNQKVWLTLSLLGILLLTFLSSHLTPKEYNIINVTESKVGDYVVVKGQISGIRNFQESEFYILTIKDETGKITGTLNSKNLSINKTQEYLITGKITKYKNETQINIEKIIENDS